MDLANLISAAAAAAAVVIALAAFVVSLVNMHSWHQRMKTEMGFPRIADVLSGAVSYRVNLVKIFDDIQTDLADLVENRIDWTAFRDKIQGDAELKYPVGTFKSAGETVHLVYPSFDADLVSKLHREALKVYNPIRHWHTEQDVWDWLESETLINRDMTKAEIHAALNNKSFFARRSEIVRLLDKIEAAAKECAKRVDAE